MLKLFNSLSHRVEPLPSGAELGIYTCGPTVYDYAHIGNLRAYVFADLARRVIAQGGQKPKWVMNITDVDDKTIKRSRENYPELSPMAALNSLTRGYETLFFDDLKKINIGRDSLAAAPRATEHIEPMQKLIRQLLDNGIAYESDGSFYFSIAKYQEAGHKYGVLSKLDLAALKSTDRVAADEYDKDSLQDFALWKRAGEGEPSWDFEVGGEDYPGRPGWHIECSAMSVEYLGQPFALHTGGVDHIFPHHENEIAQTVGATGKELAKFFVHEEFLLVGGQKMAKSLGNLYTLADIEEKQIDPLALRFLYLTAHYRSKLNFTWESLAAAEKTLAGLRGFVTRLRFHLSNEEGRDEKLTEEIGSFKDKFTAALEDDLDTPAALAELSGLITQVNKAEATDLARGEVEKLLALFTHVDTLLGIGLLADEAAIPTDVMHDVNERESARSNKNYVAADSLREQIKKAGFVVEDTEYGPRVIPL